MAESSDHPERPPAPPATPLARIGDRLRQAFDEAAAEPLPQAFEDLLQQLR